MQMSVTVPYQSHTKDGLDINCLWLYYVFVGIEREILPIQKKMEDEVLL